jgi:hypothetical protein
MWQPWATFTLPRPVALHPLKGWETRHWDFRAKGGLRRLELPVSIVIHATKRFDQGFLRSIPKLYALSGYPKITLGAIIAVGTIADVWRTETLVEHWEKRADRGDPRPGFEYALGDFSPRRFGWKLENVRALRQPIPFKGRQEPLYVLDRAIAEEVDAQVRGA